MQTDPISSDDPEVLRAEIVRLRDLVGPAEQSYRDLQLDVLAARDAARGAAAEAGVYRAQTLQLETQLVRNNQLKNRVRLAVQPLIGGLNRVDRILRPPTH